MTLLGLTILGMVFFLGRKDAERTASSAPIGVTCQEYLEFSPSQQHYAELAVLNAAAGAAFQTAYNTLSKNHTQDITPDAAHLLSVLVDGTPQYSVSEVRSQIIDGCQSASNSAPIFAAAYDGLTNDYTKTILGREVHQ